MKPHKKRSFFNTAVPAQCNFFTSRKKNALDYALIQFYYFHIPQMLTSVKCYLYEYVLTISAPQLFFLLLFFLDRGRACHHYVYGFDFTYNSARYTVMDDDAFTSPKCQPLSIITLTGVQQAGIIGTEKARRCSHCCCTLQEDMYIITKKEIDSLHVPVY